MKTHTTMWIRGGKFFIYVLSLEEMSSELLEALPRTTVHDPRTCGSLDKNFLVALYVEASLPVLLAGNYTIGLELTWLSQCKYE